MRFIFGVLILLHGLIHLLYAGQSARYFQLQTGMLWPDGSWAFSRLFGNEVARNLANILLILVALAFVVGGIAILASQPWWRPVVVSAAILSSIVYIFFWNGRLQNLDAQGAVGILIDMAILIAVLIFQWPPIN